MAKKRGRPFKHPRPELTAPEPPQRSTQGEQPPEPEDTRPVVDLQAPSALDQERQAHSDRQAIKAIREELAESKLTDRQRMTLQMVQEQAEMSRILTPEQILAQPTLHRDHLAVPLWTRDDKYAETRIYRSCTDRHGQLDSAVMRGDTKVILDGQVWLMVTQSNHPERPRSEFDASGVIHPKGRQDHYLLFTLKETWDAVELVRSMHARKKMQAIEHPLLEDGKKAGAGAGAVSAELPETRLVPASGRADDLAEGEGAEITATITG